MALSKRRLSQWLLPRHLSVQTFDEDHYDEDAGALLPAPRLSVEMAKDVPVAVLPGVLDATDCAAVARLAARLQKARPDAVQQVSSTWTTSYVSCDGTFRRELPDVAARLTAAAMAAAREQMGLCLDAVTLATRCVEFHEMAEGGALSDEFHYDSGSVLTIDVMLADPRRDFAGGDLWFPSSSPDRPRGSHLVDQGDAVVFASHRYHAVRPVTSGTRRVLIVELWEGPERLCPHRCQCATAPCLLSDDDPGRVHPGRKRFSWPPRRAVRRVHTAGGEDGSP